MDAQSTHESTVAVATARAEWQQVYCNAAEPTNTKEQSCMKNIQHIYPFKCTQRAYGSLLNNLRTYMVYKDMSFMKMTLIFIFSQMKLLCMFFLRSSTSFDFSREYIFFYVLAVLAEHELPTIECIDSPPVYKSRSDQMVAGLMLGL